MRGEPPSTGDRILVGALPQSNSCPRTVDPTPTTFAEPFGSWWPDTTPRHERPDSYQESACRPQTEVGAGWDNTIGHTGGHPTAHPLDDTGGHHQSAKVG